MEMQHLVKSIHALGQVQLQQEMQKLQSQSMGDCKIAFHFGLNRRSFLQGEGSDFCLEVT